ncbi:MAG: A/G-specific adenine glycosylase [Bacteroidota bacterium]
MAQLSISYPEPEPPKEALTPARFAQRLIAWYQANKRDLPWRATRDPYRIWLSEVILQQTRVAQGLPYYERFVEAYPTVVDMANAPEEEVMRLWQGLGYYARARNMHTCARTVATQPEGQFPNNYQDLLKLKGVGKYTAAAIAATAFQEPVAAVDGNVYRVLGRLFGIEEDITSAQGIKVFAARAASLVPRQGADVYTQAIMEFGALHCTPAKPQCLSCPFREYCVAFRTHRQYSLPVKRKKVKVRQRFFYYFVLKHFGMLYMKQRKSKDIWAGLYDFHLVETSKPQEVTQLDDPLVALLQRHQGAIWEVSPRYRHLLTHQRLYVHFVSVSLTDQLLALISAHLQQASLKAFSIESTQALPKPILINNFLSGLDASSENSVVGL